MSQRIECSNRNCRWTGTFAIASTKRDGILNTYICPKCGCAEFYDIPDPVKNERAEHANALIKIIASHGRKFFEHDGYVASLEVDKNGRVWFIDEVSKRRIYTHKRDRWAGFSHGGTLQDLVRAMRDYITKGKKIPLNWLATIRINPANGDIWGYGEDARTAMRLEAATLPIIDKEAV